MKYTYTHVDEMETMVIKMIRFFLLSSSFSVFRMLFSRNYPIEMFVQGNILVENKQSNNNNNNKKGKKIK